jgi:hypothetical protein
MWMARNAGSMRSSTGLSSRRAMGGGGGGIVAVSQSSLEGAVGNSMRTDSSDSSGDDVVSSSTRGARGLVRARDTCGGGEERSLRRRVVLAPGGHGQEGLGLRRQVDHCVWRLAANAAGNTQIQRGLDN